MVLSHPSHVPLLYQLANEVTIEFNINLKETKLKTKQLWKKQIFQFFITLLTTFRPHGLQDSDLIEFQKWNWTVINVLNLQSDAEQPAFDGLKLKLGASVLAGFQSWHIPTHLPLCSGILKSSIQCHETLCHHEQRFNFCDTGGI